MDKLNNEEYEILLDLVRRIKEETDEDLKRFLIEQVKEDYPDFEKDFLNKKDGIH